MKFYVYYLIDPSTRLPFYVGKGCGKRATAHLKEAEIKRCKSMVYKKIKNLLQKGTPPLVKIRKYFENEQDALNYEIFLISLWGRRVNKTGRLFNQTIGGEGTTGWRPTKKQKENMAIAMKKALMEKYGVENASHIPGVMERIIKSHHAHYNGKYWFQTEKFLSIMKDKWNVHTINKEMKECEYCKILCNVGNYNQHHGQNCYLNLLRQKYTCPHCGVESFKMANLTRYHFNNCRSINT